MGQSKDSIDTHGHEITNGKNSGPVPWSDDEEDEEEQEEKPTCETPNYVREIREAPIEIKTQANCQADSTIKNQQPFNPSNLHSNVKQYYPINPQVPGQHVSPYIPAGGAESANRTIQAPNNRLNQSKRNFPKPPYPTSPTMPHPSQPIIRATPIPPNRAQPPTHLPKIPENPTSLQPTLQNNTTFYPPSGTNLTLPPDFIESIPISPRAIPYAPMGQDIWTDVYVIEEFPEMMEYQQPQYPQPQPQPLPIPLPLPKHLDKPQPLQYPHPQLNNFIATTALVPMDHSIYSSQTKAFQQLQGQNYPSLHELLLARQLQSIQQERERQERERQERERQERERQERERQRQSQPLVKQPIPTQHRKPIEILKKAPPDTGSKSKGSKNTLKFVFPEEQFFSQQQYQDEGALLVAFRRHYKNLETQRDEFRRSRQSARDREEYDCYFEQRRLSLQQEYQKQLLNMRYSQMNTQFQPQPRLDISATTTNIQNKGTIKEETKAMKPKKSPKDDVIVIDDEAIVIKYEDAVKIIDHNQPIINDIIQIDHNRSTGKPKFRVEKKNKEKKNKEKKNKEKIIKNTRIKDPKIKEIGIKKPSSSKKNDITSRKDESMRTRKAADWAELKEEDFASESKDEDYVVEDSDSETEEFEIENEEKEDYRDLGNRKRSVQPETQVVNEERQKRARKAVEMNEQIDLIEMDIDRGKKSSKKSSKVKFECPKCSCSFSQKYLLDFHMRTHNLEKPFVCNFCNFGCTSSSSLRSHKLIHLEDQSFTSSEVGKQIHNELSSSQTSLGSERRQENSKLARTQSRTKKPYAYCQDCGYESKSISDFKKHQRNFECTPENILESRI